jgi:hypothetical protein
MTTDVTLNGVAETLEGEEALPSLAEFADEPGGTWNPGWYAGEIVEGYTTQKGKTFLTEDAVSQKGDSRNLRICVKVLRGEQERTLQESYNYRSSDFTAERIAFVKEAREEYKGVKGRWPDADAQRSSLAIASLGQIEKAVGASFKRAQGTMVVGPLFGKKVDVRLTIDEKGYNAITFIAPVGSHVKR